MCVPIYVYVYGWILKTSNVMIDKSSATQRRRQPKRSPKRAQRNGKCNESELTEFPPSPLPHITSSYAGGAAPPRTPSRASPVN